MSGCYAHGRPDCDSCFTDAVSPPEATLRTDWRVLRADGRPIPWDRQPHAGDVGPGEQVQSRDIVIGPWLDAPARNNA